MLFLHFKTFFSCATRVISGWWFASLSTVSCSKRAVPMKEGEKKHQNTWNCLSWAIRAQLCLQAELQFQLSQLLQLGNINIRTSCFLGNIAKFLTVPWTLSHPSRHYLIVISVTLALIYISYSVISCCIMTSARYSCIPMFLEEMGKKPQLDSTSRCF